VGRSQLADVLLLSTAEALLDQEGRIRSQNSNTDMGAQAPTSREAQAAQPVSGGAREHRAGAIGDTHAAPDIATGIDGDARKVFEACARLGVSGHLLQQAASDYRTLMRLS
jgi:hypothetical protein